MFKTHSILPLLALTLALPVQAEEEINDQNTPLHLLAPDYKMPYGALKSEDVKATLDRIFSWCKEGTFRLDSYEWGITYQALMRAAEVTKETKYTDYVNSSLDSVTARPLRRLTALDDCGTITTAMMKMDGHKGGRFDKYIKRYNHFIFKEQYKLPNGMFARTRPQLNTIWLDDVYMGIPAIAEYAIWASEPKSFDAAAEMFFRFVERMWRPEKRIYRHGYVEGLRQQPSYSWGRANGWALLTNTELLTLLPKDHPLRPRLLEQYRKHVDGLCDLQSSEGLWHQLLDRNDSYLETSCTAIYCYCIARGINEGWIEGITYGGVAQLAWHALSTKVDDKGRVQGTCVGTGMAFDPAFYYYRPVSSAAAHGYGPMLWAAAEMIELLKHWYPRTNDSGLHYYSTEQTNPAPLFFLTPDGKGESITEW